MTHPVISCSSKLTLRPRCMCVCLLMSGVVLRGVSTCIEVLEFSNCTIFPVSPLEGHGEPVKWGKWCVCAQLAKWFLKKYLKKYYNAHFAIKNIPFNIFFKFGIYLLLKGQRFYGIYFLSYWNKSFWINFFNKKKIAKMLLHHDIWIKTTFYIFHQLEPLDMFGCLTSELHTVLRCPVSWQSWLTSRDMTDGAL